MTIKDLTTFNMLDHLTDLDSMVNYWSVVKEETDAVEQMAGLNTLSIAISKLVYNSQRFVTIPADVTSADQFYQWLHEEVANNDRQT